MLTVAAVGLISKALLRFGNVRVQVHGLEILEEALRENRQDRGIITSKQFRNIAQRIFNC